MIYRNELRNTIYKESISRHHLREDFESDNRTETFHDALEQHYTTLSLIGVIKEKFSYAFKEKMSEEDLRFSLYMTTSKKIRVQNLRELVSLLEERARLYIKAYSYALAGVQGHEIGDRLIAIDQQIEQNPLHNNLSFNEMTGYMLNPSLNPANASE